MIFKFIIFSKMFVFVLTKINLKELARIESNHICNTDKDCKENSFCFGNDANSSGKCKCEEHFIINRNRSYYECLETINSEGSACIRDLQCQYTLGTLSVCDKNVCKCPLGAHLAADNKCYSTANIDEICRTNYNCLLFDGTYAFCVASKCQCDFHQHSTEDKKRCVDSFQLSESCTEDDNCKTEFAACYGVCKCISGFIESEDNSKCLKAAKTFGDNCTETIQCTAYLEDTFCDEGACICKYGFHGYGNRCFLSARLGEFCTDKKQCVMRPELEISMDCIDNLCVCTQGHTLDSSYGCLIISNSTKKISLQRIFILNMYIIIFSTNFFLL